MSYIKCSYCGKSNELDRSSCLYCKNALARVNNPLTTEHIEQIKKVQKFMLSNMISMLVLIIIASMPLFNLLVLPLIVYIIASTIIFSHKVAIIFKERDHERFHRISIVIRKFWIVNIVIFALLLLLCIGFIYLTFGYNLKLTTDNFNTLLTLDLALCCSCIAWIFYTSVYSLWRWFEIYQLLNLMCQDTDHKNTHPSLWCNRFAILCTFFLLIILISIIIFILLVSTQL